MATDPLTLVDDIAIAALRDFAPLAAILPAERLQVWTEPDDIAARGDAEEMEGMRLRLDPGTSNTSNTASSSGMTLNRGYRIWFSSGGQTRQERNLIEVLVIAALTQLGELKTADGSALPVVTPLEIEQVTFGPTDPEREPPVNFERDDDDSAEWTDGMEFNIRCHADRATFLAAAIAGNWSV